MTFRPFLKASLTNWVTPAPKKQWAGVTHIDGACFGKDNKSRI
jgi:hypothetical protein